jgi:hypothetical protein
MTRTRSAGWRSCSARSACWIAVDLASRSRRPARCSAAVIVVRDRRAARSGSGARSQQFEGLASGQYATQSTSHTLIDAGLSSGSIYCVGYRQAC